MSNIVELRHVCRDYLQGDLQVHALSDVNLVVEKGAFLSLFGPSGSGKSTLLNVIGGLDRPSSGEVEIMGSRIDTLKNGELSELRCRSIGFVFQAYNLIPVLTAVENVEFVMNLQGVAAKERRERAMRTLSDVGLVGLENRLPGELSGGQQQRVAVARAIVSNPALVLADEPTANLDSHTAHSLLELMRMMNVEHGVTFIFSTHDPRVMEFATRLIELRDGRIASDQLK